MSRAKGNYTEQKKKMSHTLSPKLQLQKDTLEQLYAFILLGRHHAAIYTEFFFVPSLMAEISNSY